MKKQIEPILRRLAYSQSRVPYTYHHDWILQSCGRFSRSDIAQLPYTEDELWASALAELLVESPHSFLLGIKPEELKIVQEALSLAEKHRETIINEYLRDAS